MTTVTKKNRERHMKHGAVYLTPTCHVEPGGVHYKGALIQTDGYVFTPNAASGKPSVLIQGFMAGGRVVFSAKVLMENREIAHEKAAACENLLLQSQA